MHQYHKEVSEQILSRIISVALRHKSTLPFGAGERQMLQLERFNHYLVELQIDRNKYLKMIQ